MQAGDRVVELVAVPAVASGDGQLEHAFQPDNDQHRPGRECDRRLQCGSLRHGPPSLGSERCLPLTEFSQLVRVQTAKSGDANVSPADTAGGQRSACYRDRRGRARPRRTTASTPDAIAEVVCPSAASATAPTANTAARTKNACDEEDQREKRPISEQPYRHERRASRVWSPARHRGTDGACPF